MGEQNPAFSDQINDRQVKRLTGGRVNGFFTILSQRAINGLRLGARMRLNRVFEDERCEGRAIDLLEVLLAFSHFYKARFLVKRNGSCVVFGDFKKCVFCAQSCYFAQKIIYQAGAAAGILCLRVHRDG